MVCVLNSRGLLLLLVLLNLCSRDLLTPILLENGDRLSAAAILLEPPMGDFASYSGLHPESAILGSLKCSFSLFGDGFFFGDVLMGLTGEDGFDPGRLFMLDL